MQEVRDAVDFVIPIVEAVGATVICVGVVITAVVWLLSLVQVRPAGYEEMRLLLARYLILGIEFQLGADILSTAVSPSFEEIGQLGAVAAIRTGLNYMLERDLQAHAAKTQAASSP